MLILPIRPAVNAQQQRNWGSLTLPGRISYQAVDFRAVFALEADLFGRRDIDFGEERVVLARELAQRAVFKGVDFSVFRIASRKDNGAVPGRLPIRQHDWRRQ